ncbi:FAD-dependent oxidoreductase [Kribbella koreensis]|uniref:FAD-dependent oxidoreductase n=1 Tax=Kribbella koreensis TaxID=57909 RepID=A0ABP4AV08_9ACTN
MNATEALTERLRVEQLLLPGTAGYEEVVAIWNGAVGNRPAVVVHCESTADVQAVVHIAGEFGLPLSVRGGGHDWAGRSLAHDGVVIDLTGMRQVSVDAEARVATVGGGALISDLIAATQPHELSAATGTYGGVGLAGLTLGGGYGPINGVAGLALDNLLGAEVVLADGRVVDTDDDPELFWALRGGGGNFGVVTKLRVRLHPIPTVLAGFIMFSWTEAAAVLRAFGNQITDAPDELTAQFSVVTGPADEPVLMIAPTWSGDLAAGEKVIAQLEQLGTPLMSQVGPMPYQGILDLYEPFIENGLHVVIQTRSLAAIDDDAVEAVVRAVESMPGKKCLISTHHCHGASTRVPLEETAFGLRQPHFVVEIVPMWDPDQDGPAHQRWAREFSDALAPFALPGGYPNLLGPDEREQLDEAYGANATRLRAAKAKYDPANVFTAIGLPEAEEPHLRG